MATNTKRTRDSQRITLQCSCGKRLLASPQHAGKQVKCRACGQTVIVPANSSLPPTAVRSHVDDKPESLSRNTYIALFSLVSVLAVACVLSLVSLVWHSRSMHQVKIDAANDRISQAITSANDWLGSSSALSGGAIEQTLAEALTDQLATEKGDGESVLSQVRQRREQLAVQARIEQAQRQATAIWNDANRQIDGKRITEAISLLRTYVADPHATEKADAQQLLAEAETAVSDMLAVDTLVSMTDDDFNRVKATGEIRDGKVTHPVLVAVRTETVRRSLDKADQRREEIRIAEQKHREAERLTEERRREEERLAQLFIQQEEEVRRGAEQARLARLANASLLDIADDPDKYVDLTYTFIVWINGSTVKRAKTTNSEDQVVVDGYVLEITPGERDPNKADDVGNRFGVLPDKLTPFISSKEVARALQDILDPNYYRKFRVTFTVRAVVLNEWRSLGKRSVGYLAEISKIERP